MNTRKMEMQGLQRPLLFHLSRLCVLNLRLKVRAHSFSLSHSFSFDVSYFFELIIIFVHQTLGNIKTFFGKLLYLINGMEYYIDTQFNKGKPEGGGEQ